MKNFLFYLAGKYNSDIKLGALGIHGFVYDETETKKKAGPPKFKVTAEGYISTINHKGEKLVQPGSFIDISTVVPNTGTNRLTLRSIKDAIRHIDNDPDCGAVTILTTSKYAYKGMTSLLRSLTEGTKPATSSNPELDFLWKDIASEILELKSVSKAEFKIRQIPDHESNPGISSSEALVKLSLRAMHHNDSFSKIIISSRYLGKATQRPLLIPADKLYFNTVEKYNEPMEAFTIGKTPTEEIGYKLSDSIYVLSVANEASPMIELVKSMFFKLLAGTNIIAVIDLAALFNPTVYAGVEKYGPDSLYFDTAPNGRTNLFFISGVRIAFTIYPPATSIMAIEHFDFIRSVLTNTIAYKENKSVILPMSVIDITSMFYTDNVLKPELETGSSLVTRVLKTDVAVRLTLGVDLFNRNLLKRLEKQDPDISLVLLHEGNNYYQFFVVVCSNIGRSIWSSLAMRLLTPKGGLKKYKK